MSTIHPRPRMAYLRDDGDGGLALVVVPPEGAQLVHSLSPAEAARWLSHLGEFASRALRAKETP